MRLLCLMSIGLLLLAAGPFFVGEAYGAKGVPAISGQFKGEFARIMFGWPKRVKFTTQSSGNVLTITFEEEVGTDPASLTRSLAPYIQRASLSNDRRSIVLTLDRAHPLRTFISETNSGIDLLDAKAPATAAAPPATAPDLAKMAPAATATPPAPQPVAKPPAATAPAPEKIAQKPTEKPVEKPAPPAKAVPVAKPAPEKPKAAPVAPQPVAKPVAPPAPVDKPVKEAKKEEKAPAPEPKPAKEKEVAQATPEKPQEQPKKAAPEPKEAVSDSKAADTAAAAKEEEKPAPVEATAEDAATEEKEAKKETESEDDTDNDEAIKKDTTQVVTAARVVSGVMTIGVGKRFGATEFYFPWSERVATAVFFRGSSLWVVFNAETKVNLEALKAVLPPFITQVETVKVPGYTVLRMTTSGALFPNVYKRKENYEWVVALSRRERYPPLPIATEAHVKPPGKPYILMQALESATPVEIPDPVTGGPLTVIPNYGSGRGLFPERRFVDFTLLRTAQGVAIERRSDNLRIARLRNGLKIGTSLGAHLSEDLPELDLGHVANQTESANTFFPYMAWKTENFQAFLSKKRMLQHQITAATDVQKSMFLRSELAKLLLSEGMYYEALGMLDRIKTDAPDVYRDYQLAALRGATNFMLQRLDEAKSDFEDPALEGEEEAGLWRRAIAVMQGNETKMMKFLKYDQLYSKFYPPDIRRRLALIAADQAIGQGMYNTAYKIFDVLAAEKILAPVKDEVDYMIARMLADIGKHEEAKDLLARLVDVTQDRFVRARAEYLLYTLRYQDGDIDKKTLIKNLDRLRVAWRGDNFELNLLDLISQLYFDEKEYTEAMRAWKEILTVYPNSPQAFAAAEKMAQTFVELFNEGKADAMTPLKALALYYEFRELTPIGTAGDKMIQGLADRLAAVDLLDRAAALLSHQVKYRLEKDERSRVGARLALIYLLNREPRKTLEALQLTGYGDNPEPLENKRNHLAAMAYSDIGDWKTALSILSDDFSDDAKQIKLDIYWQNKDWANVIATAEDILGSRLDIAAPLTGPETQALLKLAIAYTFAGDRLQLQYLRDYFTPQMENSPFKESFAFITAGMDPLNPDNVVALTQHINDTKSFLDTYRKKVQEKGLSGAIK